MRERRCYARCHGAAQSVVSLSEALQVVFEMRRMWNAVALLHSKTRRQKWERGGDEACFDHAVSLACVTSASSSSSSSS
eukprot:2989016-Rhodomonas_salina.3